MGIWDSIASVPNNCLSFILQKMGLKVLRFSEQWQSRARPLGHSFLLLCLWVALFHLRFIMIIAF